MKNSRTARQSISGILLTVAVLMSGFSFAQTWNNSNFINSGFRAQNPTSGQIITALFGIGTSTGTAYTNHWQNNTCIPANINVEYVGTNMLTTTPAANTIYVLTGNQTLSAPVIINTNCVAIIASGAIIIDHNTAFPGGQNSFFRATSANAGLIIDGIQSIGGNAADAAHFLYTNLYDNITINNVSVERFLGTTLAEGAIYINAGSDNIGVFNSYIHNNNRRGIQLDTTQNVHIVNNTIVANQIGIFANMNNKTNINGNRIHNNNNDGIYITSNSQMTIDRNHIFNNGANGILTAGLQSYINIRRNNIFNNSSNGIEASNTQYSTLSNNTVHNNGDNGIKLGAINNILIDTNQVYNNQNKAIHVSGPMNNSIFHNLRLSSTIGETLFIATGTNNKFYGPIQLYGVTANTISGGLTAGVATDTQINGLGRSNGIMTLQVTASQLNTTLSKISCELGSFHIGIVGLFTTLCKDIGTIPGFARSNNIYHFGEKVLKQSNIAVYSGTNVVLSNTIFNPQLYITDKDFGGWIQTTGGVNYITGLIHYTNTNQLRIYTSQTGQYHIGGNDINTNNNNFNPGIITGTIYGGQQITVTLPWTGSNGYKIITGSLSTGSETSNIYTLFRWYDTTGPDQIILNSPAQNAQIVGNQVTLNWSAGVDTGAGISGYNYIVASNSGLTNILFSGTTTGLNATLNNIGFYPNYYRQVQGFDNLGNTGTATTGVFHYGFSGFVISINNTTFPTNSGQTFTITAYDINNNIITGYTNTVTFSITGVNTTTQTPPANYTFTTGNSGTQTFTGGLNINYPGTYTFTVQDSLNTNRSGSTIINVIGQATAIFSGTATSNTSATSGALNMQISASSYPANYTISINNLTWTTGTINGTTNVPINIGTFPNGNYTIVVTLDNGGLYTFTINIPVTVDTINPVITVQNPTTGSYQTLNQPMITLNVVETGAGISGYVVVMSGQSQVYTATNQMNNNYRAGTPLPDGVYTMMVYGYDNAGNLGTASSMFTIDNTPPVVLSGYPHQVVITNPVTFTRYVQETGGIANSYFNLMDYYGNNITNTANIPGPTTSLSAMNLGLGTLAPGIYRWNVQVVDNVGNIGSGNQGFIFGVHNALPGQIQGFMEFQSVFGNVIQYNGNIYTNTTQLQAALFANMQSNVSINGNINPTVIGVPLLAPYPYTLQAISLTPGDGIKNISALFSSGTLNPFSVAKQITLDTTAPTPTELVQPFDGAIVSGNIPFSRTGGTDTGAGLSGYMIEVSTGATFNTIIYAAPINHPIQNTTIVSGALGTGSYYRRIKSFDRVGNNSNSEVRSIIITGPSSNTTNPANATPNNFTLNTINNGMPGIAYKSNAITISGLATGQQALATVSAGTLFINGTGIGTTGLVVNGSIIEVELIASSQYNTQISSTLNIGTRSGIFSVKTINQDDLASYNGLTNTQRFQIRIIFDALVNTYGANDSRTLSFFMTLRTAIESMLGLNTLNIAQKDALEFFLGLVNNYINTIGGSNPFDGARYTAKNGRVFTITFDAARVAYTSPEFIKPAFFSSWTAMKHHIDIHNPGSLPGTLIGDVQTLGGNRGSDVEVMPNGKIYRVEQKTNGMRYSQDTLSGREFSTRAGLISRLRANNQQIRHF